MNKAVYSITRYRKPKTEKITGLGYVTDTDLVIACVSQVGNPYIRVLDSRVRKCNPIPNKPGEFRDTYIREFLLDTGKDIYETRDFEFHYYIW